MTDGIERYSQLARQVKWDTQGVRNAIELHKEGATIPFISRYRKERTRGMDEVMVEKVIQAFEDQQKLEKRIAYIKQQIEEQGKLTTELNEQLNSCESLAGVEDLYLPFKNQRKTKADEALENGLGKQAKRILSGEQNSLNFIFESGINSANYSNQNEVREGVEHILAKWFSENTWFRNQLRRLIQHKGKVVSSQKRGSTSTDVRFEKYFDFNEEVKKIPAHRFLALMKGVGEDILSVKIKVENSDLDSLVEKVYMKEKNPHSAFIREVRIRAAKKQVFPSLMNECLSELKQKSDKDSIPIFRANLEQLLLSAPVGNKRVLAIDPGFRTGCKLVCINEQGDLVHNETIYPHEPKNEVQQAKKKLKTLTESYQIETIAIGNGTAGRETEKLIKTIMFSTDVEVFVVDEAGASVYSASKIAREEFPDYDVTVRGAISIARRMQDPLAELVKITPESLGIGQYQHEVDQVLLKQVLTQTVENTVNKVGVNLNLAGRHLLKYLSGIGEKSAIQIENYRTENGAFSSKKDLLKVPGIGAKVFEQAAGFIRVPEGKHPLDNSGIHPELFPVLEKQAKSKNVALQDLIGDKEKVAHFLDDSAVKQLGEFTAKLVKEELVKPGRDPRKASKAFEFDSTIKSIKEVKEGMIIPAMVSNLTHFGAFVSIGIKENALIHKSQIAKEFVSNPADYLKLHETLRIKILSVDFENKRIGATLVF